MPTLNFGQNLNEQQRTSITNMLSSGRMLNETDARNLAYATGQSNNWQQFVGQSASNYSIGNLAQFAPPAAANTNPDNGSSSQIPNLGQSAMGSFFNNQTMSGLSQFEQSILNYTQQQESLRQQRESQAQSQYDQAFAGLEGAYNQESGESLMRRLFAEQGIQDKQNQLVELQKQLANLQNQATLANNAIGNQPINTAIIRGQQYLKQQEFAAKATLIQAQGAIVEGQLNFASDLVKGYYDAASQDRMNQINRYQTLLGLADQQLVRLNADEKDNLNMMISTLRGAEARQQENKDKISALMLDPVASIAWSKTPGLSLDMDYNEIVQRLLPGMAQERLRQFGILHGGRGDSGPGGVDSFGAGLGITGENITTDINNVARNLAAMGTNLTETQWTAAVYEIVRNNPAFRDLDDTQLAYNMVEKDLQNAVRAAREASGDTGSTTSLTPQNNNTVTRSSSGPLGFPETYSPWDVYKAFGAELPTTIFKTIPGAIYNKGEDVWKWWTTPQNKKKK